MHLMFDLILDTLFKHAIDYFYGMYQKLDPLGCVCVWGGDTVIGLSYPFIHWNDYTSSQFSEIFFSSLNQLLKSVNH